MMKTLTLINLILWCPLTLLFWEQRLCEMKEPDENALFAPVMEHLRLKLNELQGNISVGELQDRSVFSTHSGATLSGHTRLKHH